MTDRVTSYPFFQEAYLVNDLDESILKWSDLFGAGPFRKAEHHKTDRFHYRGTNQEADVSYAFGYLGDMMIQFIQQHDDRPSIYREMYKSGAEGFHHGGYKNQYHHQRSLGESYKNRGHRLRLQREYYKTQNLRQ